VESVQSFAEKVTVNVEKSSSDSAIASSCSWLRCFAKATSSWKTCPELARQCSLVRWRSHWGCLSSACNARRSAANDVTGISVYNQQSSKFEFLPGPAFSNILLADEVNRATPRTQAALLECMGERQITVDGVTRPLARPFIVLATQNPIEYEGTFPLPEAQLDRFMLKVHLGY